jgi:hypothetical protein
MSTNDYAAVTTPPSPTAVRPSTIHDETGIVRPQTVRSAITKRSAGGINADLQEYQRVFTDHGGTVMPYEDLKRAYDRLGYRHKLLGGGSSRFLSGPLAGRTYPTLMTDITEKDTGRSAFHYQSRRDAAFDAMQHLRFNTMAVVRGRVVSH